MKLGDCQSLLQDRHMEDSRSSGVRSSIQIVDIHDSDIYSEIRSQLAFT